MACFIASGKERGSVFPSVNMFYKERRPQSVTGFETEEQKKILMRKKKKKRYSSYLGNSRKVMKFSRG